MSLEKELELYRRERAGWITRGWLGRWVVIKDADVAGPFDTIEAALDAGYRTYGLDAPFMARQVAEKDLVVDSSRRAVHVPRQG